MKNLPAQVAELEPNNTPAQVSTLPFNGFGTGALNAAGDVDWWKVTTNADGKLYLKFNNTGNQDIKNVSLYDNGGVILLNSAGVGNGIGGLVTDGLAAGTFYIKINGSGGNETGAYTISDSLATLSRAIDIEPNNNISQAERLTLNDSATGHIGYYFNNHRDTTDWYKITTNADGRLDITLDNTGNQDILTLSLYDTTGTPQLNSAGVGNGIGGISTNALAAGTYYIQITGNGDPNNFGAYAISDTLIVPSRANDLEPNNNISQAERLTLNDSATGHI
ncbi:MAG: PPC domain-containing protein, partial [Ferruginibacter sp.]